MDICLKKSKGYKRFLLCTIIVCIIICAFAFVGCSKKQEQNFFNKYGKENAYNVDDGDVVHLSSSISYYLDSSVTGDYRTAIQYAISQANSLTKYTISTTKSSRSDYVVKVGNYGQTGWNAKNTYGYDDSTNEIVYSEILLNTFYMSGFSLDAKKRTCTHELGHTFGLKDLYNSEVKDYSIMYGRHGASYTFITYQKFDRENINWYYAD